MTLAVVEAALRVGPGLVVVGLVSLVFAIFIIVDMARRPGWQWQRAGSNKTLWLVLEILCLLLVGFLSIVVGVLYLAMVRPKLLAAESQDQSPSGWPAGGWPGAPGQGTWGGPPPPPPVPPTVPGPYGAPPTGPPPGWPPSGPGGPPSGEPPSGGPPSGGPPPYPGPPGTGAGAEPPGPGAGGQATPAGTTGGPPPYPGTVAQPSAPPFGWYPDPSAAHQLRYWDGVSWTEHVSDRGTQSTDPLPG